MSLHQTLRTVLLLACCTLAAPVFSADFGERMERLHLGDSEEQVLRVMDDKPAKVTRGEVAGVPRTVLVFESGNTVSTVTLVFGHLVSKSMEQQRSRLLPF